VADRGMWGGAPSGATAVGSRAKSATGMLQFRQVSDTGGMLSQGLISKGIHRLVGRYFVAREKVWVIKGRK
jgi:hypothetical protein